MPIKLWEPVEKSSCIREGGDVQITDEASDADIVRFELAPPFRPFESYFAHHAIKRILRFDRRMCASARRRISLAQKAMPRWNMTFSSIWSGHKQFASKHRYFRSSAKSSTS